MRPLCIWHYSCVTGLALAEAHPWPTGLGDNGRAAALPAGCLGHAWCWPCMVLAQGFGG